ADVTFDATHARVWTRLVGDKLRLHHRVTSLPAEGDRLAVLESAIATEGAHEEEDESETGEGQERAPTARVVQIEHGEGGHLCGCEFAAATAFPEQAYEDEYDAED